MQLRVKPSAWITISGLSPAWTLSTARNRISSSVLWSRARASRRFMPHYNQCLLTYALVNIADSLGGDRIQAQRREIVRPIESRHQGDSLLIVGPYDRDLFLHHLLPGVPGDRAERRRLVEQLEKRHGVVPVVVRGHGAPESEGFLLGGVVHGVLIHPGRHVADGMPIDDDVHVQIGGPLHRLVQQLDVFDGGSFPPCDWMHGNGEADLRTGAD